MLLPALAKPEYRRGYGPLLVSIQERGGGLEPAAAAPIIPVVEVANSAIQAISKGYLQALERRVQCLTQGGVVEVPGDSHSRIRIVLAPILVKPLCGQSDT